MRLLPLVISARSLGLAVMVASYQAAHASPDDIQPALGTDARWRDDADDVTLYIRGIGERIASSPTSFFAVAGVAGLFCGYRVLRRRWP
jgi:hypothetical protein